MDELTSVYIQESREQLAEMEAGLLRLEQNPDDSDNINAIFRAAHTIKGGSGVIECAFIEHFTHRVENLLDALRNFRQHRQQCAHDHLDRQGFALFTPLFQQANNGADNRIHGGLHPVAALLR